MYVANVPIHVYATRKINTIDWQKHYLYSNVTLPHLLHLQIMSREKVFGDAIHLILTGEIALFCMSKLRLALRCFIVFADN